VYRGPVWPPQRLATNDNLTGLDIDLTELPVNRAPALTVIDFNLGAAFLIRGYPENAPICDGEYRLARADFQIQTTMV